MGYFMIKAPHHSPVAVYNHFKCKEQRFIAMKVRLLNQSSIFDS